MNLLPNKLCNLSPIYGNRNVFGDNVFIKPYQQLNFPDKLKVACDLVRQTMLVNNTPNPNNDFQTLTGDSYTACIVLKNYLIQNKLGVSHKVCFAKQSIYESEHTPTTHFIVIVSDNKQNYFQIDPSPYVGYKCGKVESIKKKWYKEYVAVEGAIKIALDTLRQNIYEIANQKDMSQLDKTLKVGYSRKVYQKYNILKGYYFLTCKLCNFHETLAEEKKIKQIDFNIMCKQLEYDEKKLLNLKATGKLIDYLELLQSMSSEKRKYGLLPEIYVNINGENKRIDELTPRYFFEKKLNLAIIKTSSFFINCNKEFEISLSDNHLITGCYTVNLGESESYGYSKMLFFHPDGYKYIHEMNGPNKVFLIQDEVKSILLRKKYIRKKYAPNFDGKFFTWYDGKEIEWTSLGMNLVHSADNSSETCCHYQCAYPDYQLMTRFMYPNLKLIY